MMSLADDVGVTRTHPRSQRPSTSYQISRLSDQMSRTKVLGISNRSSSPANSSCQNDSLLRFVLLGAEQVLKFPCPMGASESGEASTLPSAGLGFLEPLES